VERQPAAGQHFLWGERDGIGDPREQFDGGWDRSGNRIESSVAGERVHVQLRWGRLQPRDVYGLHAGHAAARQRAGRCFIASGDEHGPAICSVRARFDRRLDRSSGQHAKRLCRGYLRGSGVRLHAVHNAGLSWVWRSGGQWRQHFSVDQRRPKRRRALRCVSLFGDESRERRQRRRRERVRAGHLRRRLGLHALHATRVRLHRWNAGQRANHFRDHQPDRPLHYVRLLGDQSRLVHIEPVPAGHLRRRFGLHSLDAAAPVKSRTGF
jgi:hypothetical protein